MRLIADVSSEIWGNVLSQYRPVHEALRFPVLGRPVHPREAQSALDAAFRAGLRNLLLDGRPVRVVPPGAGRQPPAEPC
jgi:uncharacterized Fe-S radical SAM superfamily protein PflX